MQPSPIRTDTNDFANDTFARRLPQMIRDIQAQNDYPVKIIAALDELREQLINNASLPPSPLLAPDSDTWLEALEEHKGATWQGAEFLFAETYFFHLINEIVQYWQSAHDPYERDKQEVVDNQNFLRQLAQIPARSGLIKDYLSEFLALSLWGNRVDLSLPEMMANQSQNVETEDLLVDNRAVAIEHMTSSAGTVHIITDNFGTELAMDLLLVEGLLTLMIPVVLHVKMCPTYVSDATSRDVIWAVDLLKRHHPPSFLRIEKSLLSGLLRIAPNFFWNSPHFLDKLPEHLTKLFADASLLIIKGDVNYRRAFFDTIWPVDTLASEIVNYLPAPALFLRTLKSDCLAGVPRALAEKAEAANPNWRRLGKYGLIQYINVSSHK